MTNVDCYNCGSANYRFYASENGFDLVKCLECGLLFVNPRPTLQEIAQAHIYGVHQGSTKLEVTGSFNEEKIGVYLNVLKALYGTELDHEKKTLLDIGCGHGEFIAAIQQFSNNKVVATGMEPNVHKQRSAQKRGLDVSYFDIDTHTRRYDFLSLLNVYSHLPDPKESLMRWKDLLKHDGELLLETGDTANLSSKYHHRPFCLPDHLSFASEDIVVNILEKSGFEILDVKKYPKLRVSTRVVKEIVKLFWPNKKSMIKHMLKTYSRDMYVRAKLGS